GKSYQRVKESKAYIPGPINIPTPPEFRLDDKWEMLFNGEDLSQWRHYDVTIPPYMLYIDRRAASQGPIDYTMSPARWKVENGTVVARPGYGDIITRQYFNNYDLRFDFY